MSQIPGNTHAWSKVMAQFSAMPPIRNSRFLRIFSEWMTANEPNNTNNMKSLVRGAIALFNFEASCSDRRAPDNINAPAINTPDPVDFSKRTFGRNLRNKSERKKQKSDGMTP